MSLFQEYASHCDKAVFCESTGVDEGDLARAVAAMQKWLQVTDTMLECLEHLPEVQGNVGGTVGGVSDGPKLIETIALELQRTKHTLVEAGLAETASRLNQYSARVQSALEQLKNEEADD